MQFTCWKANKSTENANGFAIKNSYVPSVCLGQHIWCQSSLSPAGWDGGRWGQTGTVPWHPAARDNSHDDILGMVLRDVRGKGREHEGGKYHFTCVLFISVFAYSDTVNEAPADQQCIHVNTQTLHSAQTEQQATQLIMRWRLGKHIDSVPSKMTPLPALFTTTFHIFRASEESNRPPESVLIFHYPQGRYTRAIKYSYSGSRHLWKLWEISAAEKDLEMHRDKV